jgi:hypothetical protein
MIGLLATAASEAKINPYAELSYKGDEARINISSQRLQTR